MSARTNLRLAVSLALLALPLVAAALACGPGGGPRPTATPAGCAVPDLIGLNQAAASKQLTELGLTPRRVERTSDEPVGVVIALDPPPGTQIAGCSGTVTMIVSSGSGEVAPTPTKPPAASPTVTLIPPTRPPSSGGSGEWPEQDDLNWFYTTFYVETFDERQFGFRPEWSVDAAEGSATADEDGYLATNRYVAAFIGDTSWSNYRVTFGGGNYDEITSFQVWVRMLDNQNFIGMACEMTDGWLTCNGYKYVNGGEQSLSGFRQPIRFCARGQQQCDIAIEAIGSDYQVLVNDEQVVAFTDDSFYDGGIGFGVDGTFYLDYVHVFEPGGGAMPAGTLFRDDFDTNAWKQEVSDDEYAVVYKQIENDVYHWKVTAKRGVTSSQMRQLAVPFDPEGFPYHFDYSVRARMVRAPAGAAYGLLFRMRDYVNYYYFQVMVDGNCNLYALENDQWAKVAGPYYVEGFDPQAENELRVVADDTRFSFWVNGVYIFQVTDDRFRYDSGIGLAVELSDMGDEGEFTFDNVRIGTSTWGGQ